MIKKCLNIKFKFEIIKRKFIKINFINSVYLNYYFKIY